MYGFTCSTDLSKKQTHAAPSSHTSSEIQHPLDGGKKYATIAPKFRQLYRIDAVKATSFLTFFTFLNKSGFSQKRLFFTKTPIFSRSRYESYSRSSHPGRFLPRRWPYASFWDGFFGLLAPHAPRCILSASSLQTTFQTPLG